MHCWLAVAQMQLSSCGGQQIATLELALSRLTGYLNQTLQIFIDKFLHEINTNTAPFYSIWAERSALKILISKHQDD
jgi:hypothetical protein